VDAFAKFFQSIYSDRAAVYTKFDSVSNHNNISLCSVSADEVFQSIKRIKSNYVQGPDGIPAFFVKDCASVLSQPFPEIWKISKILPTHKAKDRSVIENYRPISIINNFAKIFESLIFDQLYFALSKLISPSQHGFMRGRSTTTNLFCATQIISDSIDKGAYRHATEHRNATSSRIKCVGLSASHQRNVALSRCTTWVQVWTGGRNKLAFRLGSVSFE
jgi:hypothetical protein